MIKDLKHQLENVYGYNGDDITVTPSIKVKNNSMQGETELKYIFKTSSKKPSWKICDVWNNIYTISSLPTSIQFQICEALLSMKDNRYPFEQKDIYKL